MNEDQEFIEYEAFANSMETKYPGLFDKQYGGFAVGKGWWPILDRLCSAIHAHVKHTANRDNPCPPVRIDQIKEKFGGLRFYYRGGDDYVSGLVQMAELWANCSCEECGAPGKKSSGGWIRTLCDVHEAERIARQEQYAKENGLNNDNA